jgi:hypothetical protein
MNAFASIVFARLLSRPTASATPISERAGLRGGRGGGAVVVPITRAGLKVMLPVGIERMLLPKALAYKFSLAYSETASV